jgi:HlyD family secretion protein
MVGSMSWSCVGAWSLAAALAAAPVLAAQPTPDIGATGVIEPRGGVVMVSGVPGATILSIDVRVGEAVKRGALLMTLNDRDARLAAHLQLVALDEARRHASQLNADEAASLSLAQDRVARAQKQLDDYRSLGPDATSQIQVAGYERGLAEARASLAIERRRAAQVRADGVDNVGNAARQYDLARAKLADYNVTAPSDGVILQISQHVGEVLSGPAVEMGDISAMYVLCDAFQGDLLKIAPGMRATVSSNAFSAPLNGQVEWVGRLVQTKSQTGQFRIKLDDAVLPSRLVGMEVNVKVFR